jgi:hypothetical protein
MNNKMITLGSAQIGFSHEYESKHSTDKNGITKVVSVPKATTVTIKTDKEEVSAKASCSSKDLFRFETGRKLALKKAFTHTTSLTKDDRKRIWDEYNKLKPGGRW